MSYALTGCGGDDDDNGSSSGSGGTTGGSGGNGGGSTTNTSGTSSTSDSGTGGTSSGGAGGATTTTSDTSNTTGSAGGAGDAGAGGMAAESTMFSVTIENLEPTLSIRQSGAFTTPTGADGPAPIGPGESYEVTFAAAPGDKLSVTTMFVQSNDLLLAPDAAGIELFDMDDMPISGDVTDQLMVWDAGTEENQALGEGADQAPRQSGPNTGAADTDPNVRTVGAAEYSNLPAIADMFSAMLAADADGIHFTLTLTNESMEGDLMTSGDPTNVVFSPGVFAVHTSDDVLFAAGGPASVGLERIAEDGDPSMMLSAGLAPNTGILTPLAPGVFTVHASGGLFTPGETDAGLGLEELAEDGNAGVLGDAVMDLSFVSDSGVFNTPDGATDPGPALPGSSYSFSFEASPGDRLSFASMFVQSNDLFFAPAADGLALFDSNDDPIDGDITEMVMLWDAGTEVNEAPGLGPNQAPRQSGPDTGDDEGGNVMLVDDGYSYGLSTTLLRVTVTPQ
jgi:hypothetical protein